MNLSFFHEIDPKLGYYVLHKKKSFDADVFDSGMPVFILRF
jgi:hypothetical protein